MVRWVEHWTMELLKLIVSCTWHQFLRGERLNKPTETQINLVKSIITQNRYVKNKRKFLPEDVQLDRVAPLIADSPPANSTTMHSKLVPKNINLYLGKPAYLLGLAKTPYILCRWCNLKSIRTYNVLISFIGRFLNIFMKEFLNFSALQQKFLHEI